MCVFCACLSVSVMCICEMEVVLQAEVCWCVGVYTRANEMENAVQATCIGVGARVRVRA